MIVDDLDGASLLDAATRPTRWQGLLFIPVALWTPNGWGEGTQGERLEAYSTAYLPLGVQPDGENLLEYSNALWVRARLPVALGFAPPTGRQSVRWRFLDAALVAVSVDAGVPQITPFICTDCVHELEAELRFGPTCPADWRRHIASAFWGLLASAPADLASYRDRFMASDGHGISPTVAGFWRGQFHLGSSRR